MNLTPTPVCDTAPNDGVLIYKDSDDKIEMIYIDGKPFIRIVDLKKPKDEGLLFDFYFIKSTILSLDRSIRKSQEAKK